MAIRLNVQTFLDLSKAKAQLKQFEQGQKMKVTVDARGAKEAGRSFTAMEKGMKGAKTSGAQATTIFGKMGQSAKKMGSEFTSTIGKVAKFGLATAAIGAFSSAVYGAFDAVKELDDSLTEFKKVSDLRGDALKSYTKKLGDVGEVTGRTTANMVDAATEFKKAGYSDTDSLKLSKWATMFQNVADSEVSAGEAAGLITSQLKAFKKEGLNAEQVIDGINAVSNNFAVSSTDISLALSKTSSAFAANGNNYAQTIG